MAAIIAILTDFGTEEAYVGVMKGVIAGIAPSVTTIDLTHQIPPGDILRGAVELWQSMAYFPSETVFLAVVDPGVGTSRKPLLIQTKDDLSNKVFKLIGPDNGLFSLVLGDSFQAWELSNPGYRLPAPSNTFHGRDLFAPAAAYASLGIPGVEFGPPLTEILRLPAPRLVSAPSGQLTGEVLYYDRFGNLLSSLGRFEQAGEYRVTLKPWVPGAAQTEYDVRRARLLLPDGKQLSVVKTFDDIPPGGCAVLVGSSGLLEIAAQGKSAAEQLRLERGAQLTLFEV